MRLWHYKLLKFLPDLQFKGQLREIIAIMHDWKDRGKTNHLLINKVMEYDKSELYTYFLLYEANYRERYDKFISSKYGAEFHDFAKECRILNDVINNGLYHGWHDKNYLRFNMANLAEKHFYAIGKSKISDNEWSKLLEGYNIITGENYVI